MEENKVSLTYILTLGGQKREQNEKQTIYYYGICIDIRKTLFNRTSTCILSSNRFNPGRKSQSNAREFFIFYWLNLTYV